MSSLVQDSIATPIYFAATWSSQDIAKEWVVLSREASECNFVYFKFYITSDIAWACHEIEGIRLSSVFSWDVHKDFCIGWTPICGDIFHWIAVDRSLLKSIALSSDFKSWLRLFITSEFITIQWDIQDRNRHHLKWTLTLYRLVDSAMYSMLQTLIVPTTWWSAVIWCIEMIEVVSQLLGRALCVGIYDLNGIACGS